MVVLAKYSAARWLLAIIGGAFFLLVANIFVLSVPSVSADLQTHLDWCTNNASALAENAAPGDLTYEQCAAFAQLYADTNGANRTDKTGWFTTTDVCTWDRVSCDSNILSLQLNSNGLSGNISDMSGFGSVRDVFLANNNIGSVDLGSLGFVQLFLHTSPISSIDFSNTPDPTNVLDLRFFNSNLEALDIASFTSLTTLYVFGANLNSLVAGHPSTYTNSGVLADGNADFSDNYLCEESLDTDTIAFLDAFDSDWRDSQICGVFAGGDGTEESPYQINTCLQLQAMNNDLDAHYELVDHVDCSDTVNWINDYGTGFLPIGKTYNEDFEELETLEFYGSLDGSGFTITGLYIAYVHPDEPDTSYFAYEYIGLFSIIANGGSVSNITLVNPTIVGNYYVGGIVGLLAGSSLSNVHMVDAYIRALHGEYGGGIAANTYEATIDGCSVSGRVRGSGRYIGGVVGDAFIYSLSDCYVTADVDGGESVGGIVGTSRDGSINTVSYSGTIVGGPLLVDGDSWDSYYGDPESFFIDKLGCFGGIIGTDHAVYPYRNDDFLTSVVGWTFTGQVLDTNTPDQGSTGILLGCGDDEEDEEDETFTPISTCQQFMDIANNLGGNYVLTGNLNCVANGNSVRLGSYDDQFTGTLDGAGYMIEINLQGTQGSVALFNFTSGATITNLTVSGTVLQNATNGGGVVAGVVATNRGGATTLTNVHFYGDVTMQNPNGYAGGIVGSAHVGTFMDLENVSFSGNLSSTAALGGIVADTYDFASLTISGALVSGVLSGGSWLAGGIIPLTPDDGDFVIHNSVVTADFSAVTAPAPGGVVGYASCNQEYRNTRVLNNNNEWPTGLEAFGNVCGGGNQGGGQQGGNQGGGGGSSGGGGGGRWVNTTTAPAPAMPKLKLNQIEKKTPQQFCGTTDHLSSGPSFGDLPGTRYTDAVDTLVKHCLVDGYNNEGKEFGINNPLTAGEMFKIFAKMSLTSIDKSVTGMGWSYGYKTAGDAIGLWNSIGNLDQNAPVTQTELLQVAFNYMQHMGLINEVPTFPSSNKAITRGEFARFINVVLGLVSTK